MKNYLCLLTLLVPLFTMSQGISFSYLIPKNGYLAAPVSPLSIRGVGIGKTVGLETGATFYNVPGLAMEEMPFESEKPLTGPHYGLLIPGELFLKIPLGPVSLKFMAGGFLWWNIGTRINEGNMDRAFRAYTSLEVLNTDLTIQSKTGSGLMGGLELEVRITDRFSITAESQYLMGASKTELSGSYTGSDASGLLTSEPVEIPDAQVVIEGMEISLGVKFSKK